MQAAARIQASSGFLLGRSHARSVDQLSFYYICLFQVFGFTRDADTSRALPYFRTTNTVVSPPNRRLLLHLKPWLHPQLRRNLSSHTTQRQQCRAIA